MGASLNQAPVYPPVFRRIFQGHLLRTGISCDPIDSTSSISAMHRDLTLSQAETRRPRRKSQVLILFPQRRGVRPAEQSADAIVEAAPLGHDMNMRPTK